MFSNLKDLEEKVKLGLEMTYERLIEFKKQKNSPLVISKDGQIVEVYVGDRATNAS